MCSLLKAGAARHCSIVYRKIGPLPLNTPLITFSTQFLHSTIEYLFNFKVARFNDLFCARYGVSDTQGAAVHGNIGFSTRAPSWPPATPSVHRVCLTTPGGSSVLFHQGALQQLIQLQLQLQLEYCLSSKTKTHHAPYGRTHSCTKSLAKRGNLKSLANKACVKERRGSWLG